MLAASVSWPRCRLIPDETSSTGAVAAEPAERSALRPAELGLALFETGRAQPGVPDGRGSEAVAAPKGRHQAAGGVGARAHQESPVVAGEISWTIVGERER